MQRTLEIIEIEDQNLYVSQSNVDHITIGGISRPTVLHQVRDQTLPGPGLILGCLEIIMAGITIVRLIIKTYLVLI